MTQEAEPQKPKRGRKTTEQDPNDPSAWGRVLRNAPCPCGSGKKYKHCHGSLDNKDEESSEQA